MFQRLLTPLRARFEVAPTPKPVPRSSLASEISEPELSPENFQRDARIELMRNWVDSVKSTDDIMEKIQLLAEIQRIMVEDAATKDVFRECDGFVVLVNLLSTLRPPMSDDAQGSTETGEAARLAFAILAEGMRGHQANIDFFDHRVGYDSLEQSVLQLATNSRTVDQVFGFLVALSLQDFSPAGLFVSLRAAGGLHEAEAQIGQFASRFGPIYAPKAILVAVHLLPQEDELLQYALFKVLERLAVSSHRNQAALNALGLVGILFPRLYPEEGETALPEQLRAIMAKLLRRMLDMGASTREARAIFKRAVGEDGTLRMPVVELLRSGMRAKWPEYFSLEGSAALALKETAPKGMPCPAGFSFICWLSV
ncbi:hypothetical protein EXIGLDRAFT_568208, partial [Exidia glandulosa HHB12029]